MTRSFALAAAALMLGAVSARAQPETRDYVARAGAADKFEMAEARIAEARSHNPRVLAFARTMVRDHTKSTAMVVRAATRSMGHAPRPATLEDHQRDEIRDLRGTPPQDFDRVYMTQQATAHRDALDLHRHYAEDGPDPWASARGRR